MHLIDDIDFVTGRNRTVPHLFNNLTNIINTGMRGSIHLDHIDMAAFHNRLTVFPQFGQMHTRLINRIGFIIQAARQNTRGCGLTHPAHTGQHPCLRNASCFKSIGQGAHHRLLTIKIIKVLRAVFTGENAISIICRFIIHGFRALLQIPSLNFTAVAQIVSRLKTESGLSENLAFPCTTIWISGEKKVGGWHDDPCRAR